MYSSLCHDDLTNIDVLESNVMKGEQEVSLLITSINLIALETVDWLEDFTVAEAVPTLLDSNTKDRDIPAQ